MKKLLAIFLVIPSLCFSRGDKPTYSFLRLDASARAAALNGSFVSMTNDPNVIFYNPASLTTMENNTASLSYFKHLLDVKGGTLAATYKYEDIGIFGFGVSYLNYGDFTETDADMNILGSFGAKDLVLIAGYSTYIDENTLVGANIKAIYSGIADYRSGAIAFDFGILYRLAERTTIGGSILHLGTQLNAYGSTKEPLPIDVKIGITHQPEHLPAVLNLNFHKLADDRPTLIERFRSFTVGVEFLMGKSVRLRGGLSNEQRKDLKLGTSTGMAGFAIGGGLLLGGYQIDYAFNSLGKIGGLHRISVSTDF